MEDHVCQVVAPYDIAGALRIDPALYVGKFVTDGDSIETKFMAFQNETGGQFMPEITDRRTFSSKGHRVCVPVGVTNRRALSDHERAAPCAFVAGGGARAGRALRLPRHGRTLSCRQLP